MAVALYLRVSTEEQRERQSIATQREFAARYCDLHALTIYASYADDGVSGTVPIEQRQIGRRLLEDAQLRRFDQLLVFKLDRLGRDTRLILNVVAELEKHGVRVRSMTEEFDTATSTGRLMLTLLSGFAAHERELIRERSMAGSNRLAQTGTWLGGVVPYGYAKQGERSAARLVASEDPIPGFASSPAEIVRSIFRMCTVEKLSCQRVADHLNQLGIPVPSQTSPAGRSHRDDSETTRNVPWRPSQVRNMIINRVYMGQHLFGKRSRNPGRKPISRAVPALVSEPVWKEAQRMLHANQSRCAQPGSEYLLSGFIRCGLCGLNYSGKRKGGAQRDHIYQCNGRLFPKKLYGIGGRRCMARALAGATVENCIVGEIEAFLQHPEAVLEQLQQQLLRHHRDRPLQQQQLDSFSAQLDANTAQRDRILALFRRARIDEQTLDRQLDLIQAEADSLEKQREGLKRSLAISDPAAQLAGARQYLESLAPLRATEPSHAIRRHLVELLVDSVEANPVEHHGRRSNEIVVRYRFHAPGSVEAPQLCLVRRYIFAGRNAPSDAPLSFGDHLRNCRLRRKLSQTQVAQQLGVGRSSVYRWEHNLQQPGPESMPCLVAFLGYHPNPSSSQ